MLQKIEEVKESTAEVEEIEEEEEVFIPNISALDVDIQRFEQPKVTLGQILEANKDKRFLLKNNQRFLIRVLDECPKERTTI